MIQKTEVAILAGGCFWGVEEILRKIPGIIKTEVGYSGGSSENPTYEKLKRGDTGHAEAVQITFFPEQITYASLLEYFFRLHNPTTVDQQGNDIGSQYRSAIFYLDETQKQTALLCKNNAQKSGRWKNEIVTEVTAAKPFYPAEDYHQKYLQKNPNGYNCHYLRD